MSDDVDFTAVLRRHDDRLRGLAYRLLNDKDRMDDVLQEAYLKAYRARRSFREGSDIGTWLYRIVYNACLDDLRKGKRRLDEPFGHRDLPSYAPQPDDRLPERSRLAVAFDALTEEQKTVVWLVDVEGFDYAAAAAVLDIAPGTVGSRLNRAHRALRELLGEDES